MYNVKQFNLELVDYKKDDQYGEFTKKVSGIWQKELLDFLYKSYDEDKILSMIENNNNSLSDHDIATIDYVKKMILESHDLSTNYIDYVGDDNMIVDMNKYFKIIIDDILVSSDILESINKFVEKESIYYCGGSVYKGSQDNVMLYYLDLFNEEMSFHTKYVFDLYESIYDDEYDEFSDEDDDCECDSDIESLFFEFTDDQIIDKIYGYMTHNYDNFVRVTKRNNDKKTIIYDVNPIKYLRDICENNYTKNSYEIIF